MWFKKKPESDEVEKAAGIFADRDKKPPVPPPDEGGGGVQLERRMFEYTKIKGADEYKKSDEERRAEIQRTREDSRQAASVISNFTDNTRNKMVYGIQVEAKEKLTDEERRVLEQQGMDRLGSIVDRRKNKGFITEVKPESKNVNSTLSEEEILAATKKIRNEGYFTETRPAEKALTDEQKAKRDQEDLESAAKAVATLMGASFYAKKQSDTGEENGENDSGDENSGSSSTSHSHGGNFGGGNWNRGSSENKGGN